MDMSVDVGGLALKNPVLVASGTFGYGREFDKLFDIAALGAIMVKGVSTLPWAGNPGRRIAETPAGMLNAIGLQNPGLEHFIGVDLPWLREKGATVVVNVVGHTSAEYVAVASAVSAAGGVAAIEINVSCPNIEGGLDFGTDPAGLADLVAAVRRSTALPLFVKLSPNVTDILPLARAAVEEGADGLSLINTVLGLAIDVEARRPSLGHVTGGLSGPAVKPIALRFVYEVRSHLDVPIIGMGGIATARDALEFIYAGANAVAVGSALFRNPLAAVEVAEGLGSLMEKEGFACVAEASGAAQLGRDRFGPS